MNKQITLDEFREIAKYLIANNKNLVESGKSPIAIGIEGSAGLGKTTLLKQIADELGMSYVRLNLAELEEVSDLTGFPIKEYQLQDGNWISADLIAKQDNPQMCFTGKTRMTYATPSWLPDEENTNGVILALDDYTRANSLFMQATMQLIQDGTYISWHLPKNTNIVLSSNPDDGAYSVTSLDPAQRSRFVNFNVKFSIDNWAKWAEVNDIDNRVINFALHYSTELFEDPKHANNINPRSYTMFGNAIRGIKDWSNPDSLALILNISKGCFTDENNIIGSLFTTFIANKLDKLIPPKDMLLGDWDKIGKRMEECVYDGDEYKPAIAAILHTRILNYASFYLSDGNNKADVVSDRLIKILDGYNGKMLFTDDLMFSILKRLIVDYPKRMNKLMLNPRIRSAVIV